jgi:hypothetical protein
MNTKEQADVAESGLRAALRMLCPKGLAGSNPVIGTTTLIWANRKQGRSEHTDTEASKPGGMLLC